MSFQAICPCLTWIWRKKPIAENKKYDGVHELQEEEFMQQLETEAHRINQNRHEAVGEHSIEEQMDVELGLTTPPHNYFQETHKEQPTQSLLEEEQVTIEFKNNLPHYDPYYQTIQQATKNIKQLFTPTSYTPIKVDNELNCKLKAFGNTSSRGGQFLLQFQLPCSYSYYEQFCNTAIPPKSHKLVHEYKQIQSLKPNLNVKYLCLNKVGMLEPRDFTYVKYTNGVDNEHWQVCVSKDEFHPKDTKAKLGKLHLLSHIVEEEHRIRVETYVDVDLSGNMIENVWGKITGDVVGYLEEVWGKMADNYQQELV